MTLVNFLWVYGAVLSMRNLGCKRVALEGNFGGDLYHQQNNILILTQDDNHLIFDLGRLQSPKYISFI